MLLFWILLLFVLILAVYFSFGRTEQAEDINWGVNFSQKHAENLGLDWKETYLALLDDLGVRDIKIAVHWDLIEPKEGKYNFEDLDWQINEIKKRQGRALLAIGMKTPRWPECHIPDWALGLNKEFQQEKVLKLVENIVLKYKGEAVVWAWQVENEPFFEFGNCPWSGDEEFLKKEIETVKSADALDRSVIISDTGEFSLWLKPAKIGDIIGITIYRKVWSEQINLYIGFPFSPVFYWRKIQFIKKFFDKEVLCVELQAEPWAKELLYSFSLEEQEKTMNLEQFKKNIEFAKRTGLNIFYFWGAEWWHWMKEKQGKPEIWDEARKIWNH